MQRKTVTVSLSVAAMVLVLAAVAWWKLGGYYTVSVINIFNFQSRLEPFAEAEDGELSQNSYGGAAYIKAAIDQLHKIDPNALVTETGDLVMGPWWRLWEGEPEFQVASLMGLGIGMLGNHELNLGQEHLKRSLKKHATIPILATNIAFDDQELAALVEDIAILETPAGLKVGFFSLVPPSFINSTRAGRGVSVYPQSTKIAQRAVNRLLRRGAEAVIMLSHASLEDDRILARELEGLSLIISGESHYGRKAGITWVTGQGGWPVGIATAGDNGKTLPMYTLTLHRGRPVPEMSAIEVKTLSKSLTPDPEILALTEKFNGRMNALLNDPIGSFSTAVDARRQYVRCGAAPIGDFIADALRWASGADMAVINAGSIRGDRIFPAGPISIRTVYELLPFQNHVMIKEMSGRDIRRMLEFSASALVGQNDEYESAKRVSGGGFLHVSGLTVSIALSGINKPALIDDAGQQLSGGNRVKYVGAMSGTSWSTLNDGDHYTVAMPDFLAEGGDKYRFLADLPHQNTYILESDMVIDYIKVQPNARLRLKLDGRLKIEGHNRR